MFLERALGADAMNRLRPTPKSCGIRAKSVRVARRFNQAAETFQQAQSAASAKFHEASDAVKDRVNNDDEVVVDEIRVEAVRVPPEK